jgi:citrate lyase synthetase
MQVQLSIVSASLKLYQNDINQLLEQQRLRYELDIEYLCIVRNHQAEVIGCVGLAGRILKCFAIMQTCPHFSCPFGGYG